MSGRPETSARTRRRSDATRPPARKTKSASALMIIDHERLQGAAWAEFHTARKRLEKTTRDLHRHEEIDSPAYESWVHRTFPTLVTRLRELHEEVISKARKVYTVQAQAAYSGGSLKRLWRQHKEREANPEPFEPEPPPDPHSDPDPADPFNDRHYERSAENFEREFPPPTAPSVEARDIYRRLVQRLHPDRGGEWTAKRKQLWHEVQQAWHAADADWLSRLEVEWETAHDVIGPTSPLSRLRRAILELDAARRDLEQKLRTYRRAPAWRFTRTEKKRPLLHHRTEQGFAHDIALLQRQLDHLNRTIAAWEDDWTRPQPRRRRTPR